jgi:hypothetical protein
VTCEDFHDGSEKGTASVHQMFTEILTMIQQDFGDQFLIRTQVFQWHARFKTGRTSADDVEHTGRPTSCTAPKLLREFNSSSVRVDVGPFTTLLKRWELVMGHANGF